MRRFGLRAVILTAFGGIALAQIGPTPATGEGGLPWLAGDPEAGSAAFGTTCRGCHAAPASMAGLVAGATPEERGLSLWGFLAHHFAPDETIRAGVVTYLLRESGDAGTRIGDPAAGEMGYAVACVGCHASSTRLVQRIEGEGVGGKATWLWSFLAGHHAGEEGLRADLLAYLLEGVGPSP